MLTIIAGIVYLLTAIVAFCGVFVWVCHKHKEMNKTKCKPDHSNAEEEAQQLQPNNEKLEEEIRQLQTTIGQLYDFCKDISQKLDHGEVFTSSPIAEDSMYDKAGQILLGIWERIGELETTVNLTYTEAKRRFSKADAMRQIGSFKRLTNDVINSMPDYVPELGEEFILSKMEDVDKTGNYDTVVREVVKPGKKCGTIVIAKAQVRVEVTNSEEEGGTIDGAN